MSNSHRFLGNSPPPPTNRSLEQPQQSGTQSAPNKTSTKARVFFVQKTFNIMARKKRRANYSEEELSVLLQETKRRKNILLGKYFVTIQAKNDEWEHVAAAVNAVSSVKRDRDDIRKKFYDYRTYVKRKVRSRNGEGGITDTEVMEPLSVTEEAMLDILRDLPTEVAWSEAMIAGDSEEDITSDYRNCKFNEKNFLAIGLRNFRINKEGASRTHTFLLRSFRNEVKRYEESEVNYSPRKAHGYENNPVSSRKSAIQKVTDFISLSSSSPRPRRLKKRYVHTEPLEPSHSTISKSLSVYPLRGNKVICNMDANKGISITDDSLSYHNVTVTDFPAHRNENEAITVNRIRVKKHSRSHCTSPNERTGKETECDVQTGTFQPPHSNLSKPLYVQPLRPDEEIGDEETDMRSIVDNPLGGVSMKVLISRLSSAKSMIGSERNHSVNNGRYIARTRIQSQTL